MSARAAIVLFVESNDISDPNEFATFTKLVLHKMGVMEDGLSWNLRGEEINIQVREVMEAGLAAGNGYLWMEPTSKAFPRRPEATA